MGGAAFEEAGRGARPCALSARNAKSLRKRHRVGATGPVAPTCGLSPVLTHV